MTVADTPELEVERRTTAARRRPAEPEVPVADDAPSEVHPGRTSVVIIDPPLEEERSGRDETVEERLARRRATGRRWRARILLVAVVAACITVGIVQGHERVVRAGRIAFSEVTLVGDPIDVVTTSPASVVSIAVRPGETVAAGDVLATLDTIRPAPAGGEQRVRTTLTAPVDAVVAAVPTNAGASLLAGGPVVRLYEPDKLHFEIELPLNDTTELRIGQRGLFSTEDVEPVAATLVSIEPALTPGRDGRAVAVATLLPDDPGDLEHLLVGLPFEGWLSKELPEGAPVEATPDP